MPPSATPELETETESEIESPWNVVVHNDPVNLMSYVSLIFRQVFGYSRERSEQHMLEVHQKGRSIVWTGGREKAEFYVQELHSHLLLATMEQAD
ncbi:MAG: ATP-dependent Clp protease adapter ClpS [Terrimicrobiaceae bacterium]